MAEFLRDLPARGAFTNIENGDLLRGSTMSYICEHSTAPPEGQVIETNATNLLVHHLLKQKARDAKAEAAKKATKRAAAAGGGQDPAAKRRGAVGGQAAAATGTSSAQQGASIGGGGGQTDAAGGTGGVGAEAAAAQQQQPLYTVLDLRAKTVRELTQMLDDRGVRMRGRRKDALVMAILELQQQQ